MTIAKHPVWSNRAPFWRTWLECWRGGEHFRAASVASSSVTSAGSQPIVSSWTWGDSGDDALPPAAWLWSHSRETDASYAERVARSSFRRYAGFAIDALAAGVTEGVAPPTTRLGPEWLSRVTCHGQDIRAFRRSKAIGTELFGHMWIGADRSDDENGGMPYLYLVSPLELVDWQVKRGYQLLWAVVREKVALTRPVPFTSTGVGPRSGRRDETLQVYRLWTEEYSQRFDSEGRALPGEDGAQIPNELGRVPLEIAFHVPDYSSPDPAGISVMADLAPINLHEYNLRSLRDVILTDTAFPFLAISRPEGVTSIDPESQIELATDRAVAYTGASAPVWVQPEATSVDVLTAQIREDVNAIRELAGLKIAMEDSGSAISADALRLVRANLDARFGAHASHLQDAEIRAIRMAQEIAGMGPEGVESTWPTDYGAQETGGRLDDIAKVLDLGLRDVPSGHAEALKSAVQAALSGSPTKVISTINADIDKQVHELAAKAEQNREMMANALAGMRKPVPGEDEAPAEEDEEDADQEDSPRDAA